MSETVILVGGGGHARVVGEAILAAGGSFELLGFIDSVPLPDTAATLGVPQLGGDEAIERYPDAMLALGIGAVGLPHARPGIVRRFGPARRWATVVHPSAYLSASARLAEGTVVLPHAMLHTGVRAGRHSLVNSGAVVEHDCLLGDHVLIGPGALLGGSVTVGDHAFVGLGAIIRNNVRIGREAVVAMGAVVVRDVPDGATVLGIPARAPRGAV